VFNTPTNSFSLGASGWDKLVVVVVVVVGVLHSPVVVVVVVCGSPRGAGYP